jgi:hypothetical protein
MFLPFETSFSMWFAAMPRYEWLPAPPARAESGTADECLAGTTPADSVSWAVVFRGIEWSAYPVWHAQANPAWEIVAQNRRDEADETAQERARHARQVTSR